jgi:caspase domain-containing protein
MSKGISIHIGLNRVDPNHYAGWDGQLTACEFDAKDMAALAKSQGFRSTTILLTEQATAEAALAKLRAAREELQEGDILLLTYSGHGGQVEDANSDERDRLDETWVLYDRELIDDELYNEWSYFDPGVRIFVLSDSCHSGTVTRAMFRASVEPPALRQPASVAPKRTKNMPFTVQQETYNKNKKLYDDIQRSVPSHIRSSRAMDATVILISGCQDTQLSADGDRNGLFTETLLGTWNKGAFRGTYRQFRNHIARDMPPDQKPNYSVVGTRNRAFELQRPFSISAVQAAKAA